MGIDIYQSPLRGPGDYALAFLAPVGTAAPNAGGSGFPARLAILAAAVLAGMVVALFAVRRSRRAALG